MPRVLRLSTPVGDDELGGGVEDPLHALAAARLLRDPPFALRRRPRGCYVMEDHTRLIQNMTLIHIRVSTSLGSDRPHPSGARAWPPHPNRPCRTLG